MAKATETKAAANPDLPAPDATSPTTFPAQVEGKIVRYVMNTKASRPAIIIARQDDDWGEGHGSVNLQVFTDPTTDGFENQSGIVFKENVPYSAKSKIGTWHYVEDEE